jgi:RNA polymerase sigma factor (sigma-70 family)
MLRTAVQRSSPMSLDATTVAKVLMQQRDKLFAQIWTIVGDPQLIDDVLQELAVVAVQKGVEVEDEVRLRAWLCKAARFKALEALRARHRAPLLLSDEVLDQLDLAWIDERRPLATMLSHLHSCMEKLTPNNRRILGLRYVQGKKTAEVARLLGRNVETLYKAIIRIHVSLRECIEARLAEEVAHD